MNEKQNPNVGGKISDTFPGDFKNHAHRFTRSFSWKTKGEESPFVHMQPLPKLVKKPGYLEICFKNICWPTHQLCLCCGRNTAESCRKWSKSTGEYDYVDACWSSCALCSNDALRIFNTPVVYQERIIDPELLLPLDAELLYYSIQSAKRRERNTSASSLSNVDDKLADEEIKPSPTVPFTTAISTPAAPPVIPKKSSKKPKAKKRSKSRQKKEGKSRSRSKSRKRSKSKRKSRSKSKSRIDAKSKKRSKSRKRSKSKSRKRSKSKRK